MLAVTPVREGRYTMKDKIEKALNELRSSLGGANVRLGSVKEGVVTIQYHKPLSTSATCHADKAQMTKDLVLEVIEDKLKQDVPGVKKVIIVDSV